MACERCLDSAHFGYGDLEGGQEFKQECLELLITTGPVHRSAVPGAFSVFHDRTQQGPFEQIFITENMLLFFCYGQIAVFLESDAQQLFLIVPFIHRCVDVKSFITLQA